MAVQVERLRIKNEKIFLHLNLSFILEFLNYFRVLNIGRKNLDSSSFTRTVRQKAIPFALDGYS